MIFTSASCFTFSDKSHLDIFNYTCIYTWVYLQIYEKLYNDRNNVIVQLYEYLYLGILTFIRVDIIFESYKKKCFPGGLNPKLLHQSLDLTTEMVFKK